MRAGGVKADLAVGLNPRVSVQPHRFQIVDPRPEKIIRQGIRDAAILVLVFAHVVVVVPRHIFLRPLRVEVRLCVYREIERDVRSHAQRKTGRQRQERQVQGGGTQKQRGLFRQRRIELETRVIVGVAKTVAAHVLVVVFPMETPETLALATQFMQHVLVHDPFARVTISHTGEKA